MGIQFAQRAALRVASIAIPVDSEKNVPSLVAIDATLLPRRRTVEAARMGGDHLHTLVLANCAVASFAFRCDNGAWLAQHGGSVGRTYSTGIQPATAAHLAYENSGPRAAPLFRLLERPISGRVREIAMVASTPRDGPAQNALGEAVRRTGLGRALLPQAHRLDRAATGTEIRRTQHWTPGSQKKRANPDGDARQRLPLPVQGTVGIISHIAATVGSEECHLRINILILLAEPTFRNWLMCGGAMPGKWGIPLELRRRGAAASR